MNRPGIKGKTFSIVIPTGRMGMQIFEQALLLSINKNQKMKKSTTVAKKKCSPKKGGMKRTNTKTTAASPSPYTTTRVADNIGKMPNGMYRARKAVDGVKYSRNFSNLKLAKAWVKSL